MKKLVMNAVLFLLFLTVPSFSQDVDLIPTCGTGIPRGEQIDLTQKGGLHITSRGTIRVLVVFVRFKDDNAPDSYWPANDQIQPWMTQYIDPNEQTGSTNYLNLTNFFKQMSLGSYKVIGDVVYVKTPQNRSYYGTPWPSRWLVTKDVLQNKVDPLVNFANYDNWTFNSNYQHTNQPDGKIDMIVMFWRGLLIADWYLGEASLGYNNPNPPYEDYYYVENGAKMIKTGFGGGAGSGFTSQYWLDRGPEYNFHTPVHEYGHWLLGGAHPYGYGAEHNGWGMLFHGSDGICANTYERERVAWLNPTPITGDTLNAPFTDFITTGTAYKYHPPNGDSDEYYYFENHQKLSIYDDATRNPDDKGIFVLHFQGPYSNSNNDRIKPSSGQFNWVNPFSSDC